MPARLYVYAIPHVVQPEEMAGGTVVVVDVLRAATTICHALAAGATEVIPFVEVEEALAAAASLAENVVLGGEREGLPIDGFDRGNSPGEYNSESVGGKTLVFTTSNGTRALHHARLAERVLLGAFVNATAVVGQLLGKEQIHILCSGTNGQYSEDDVLLAGLLVERLERMGGLNYSQNAQAATAREYWLNSFTQPKALGADPLEPQLLIPKLRQSAGGRNLVAVGLEHDLTDAAQIDRFQCVPVYDPASGRIRL
jgi:2-phosphosulfolactate phosphatase